MSETPSETITGRAAALIASAEEHLEIMQTFVLRELGLSSEDTTSLTDKHYWCWPLPRGPI